MSSDNYYVVRKHPQGGFTYVMGFASDDIDQYDIPVRKGEWGWSRSWPTFEEALSAAFEDYSEYGVSVHPECREAVKKIEAKEDARREARRAR